MDQTIIAYATKAGPKKWVNLTALPPRRLGKQCRERWHNHLGPGAIRETWTAEENAMLLDLHECIGSHWVRIAESLPGRSENAVKNRWKIVRRREHGERFCARAGGAWWVWLAFQHVRPLF
jgi:myb proto-oncogene protein